MAVSSGPPEVPTTNDWNWETQAGNKICELVLNVELVTFKRELGLKWDLVLELELETGT